MKYAPTLKRMNYLLPRDLNMIAMTNVVNAKQIKAVITANWNKTKIYELFEILFIIYVINHAMRNRRSLVAGLLVSMIGWNCPCNKILKLKKDTGQYK